MSKLLEKVTTRQRDKQLDKYELYLSAYTMLHSRETNLMKVQGYLFQALVKKKVAVLVLLDLSSAFDTTDQQMLLPLFKAMCGITCTALQWMSSCSCHRFQSVIENSMMYIKPWGNYKRRHKMAYRKYTDDTQLYPSFEQIFESLKLICNKIEFRFIAPKNAPVLRYIRVCATTIIPSYSVRNLGVVMDKTMTMDKTSIMLSCYSLLRNTRHIEIIQNTGARIITQTHCDQQFMPVLAALHWLPVNK